MQNRLSLHPPAEHDEHTEKQHKKSAEIESAIEDAMQQWISKALVSDDARDRVAVAHGISRGVFGSLHLGVGLCAESPESTVAKANLYKSSQSEAGHGDVDEAQKDTGQFEEFKRAA